MDGTWIGVRGTCQRVGGTGKASDRGRGTGKKHRQGER